MSVMNRKMFANRDARNKLAGMGGILASSPELMNATQRFQDGGVPTPRGVPDSPRLSESLEASAPVAVIGGKSFFLSEDGGFIVDAEGSVVRDPSVLRAVMDQTGSQVGVIPREVVPAAPEVTPSTPELPPSVDEVRIQPELPPEGIMATIAALATADDNRKNEILSPSYDPNNRGAPEEFQPEISPEMAKQLQVLEQRRTSRDIAEGAGDLAKGAGQGAVTGAKLFNDALNVTGGYLADTGLTGLSLGADALGYLTGGGGVSGALFNAADSLSDAADTFTPEGNLLPRLFNGAEPEPEPDLEAERLAQIEAESLRNISDGMVAGDDALFAEGAPVESLGGNFPDSIIEARIMESPSTPRFSSAGDGPQSLPSLEMTDEALELNMPVEEMPVDPALAPSLPGYDTSTGVPLTMDEVSASVLAEREQAAAAGLGNTPEQEDRFPQEDARIAAQEAELLKIRARRLSDQEREQMAMGTNTGTGLTVEDAADVMPPVATEEGGPGRTDTEIQDQLTGIAESDESPEDKSGAYANTLLGTEGLGPRETVEAYEAKFNEMLGVEDQDKSREMWNNMAMIGFAIAAGESPNALQNIANGMLAGTKMMKDDKTAAQARRDEIALLAASEANEDRRLDARIRSAERIAEMRSSATGDRREPFVDAVRVLAQKGLDSSIYKTMDEALAAADAALRPYYQETLPPRPASGGDGDDEMVTVVQNGVSITVPKSQLP